MNTATAFRVGDHYSLQPDGKQCVEVTIGLADDVRIRSNTLGQQLVYRHGYPYGVSLTVALALGWCWLVEPESAEE